MTIWPRKHKRKTPSQAFTRSKQIYRFGRSLKLCGTVHINVCYLSRRKSSKLCKFDKGTLTIDQHVFFSTGAFNFGLNFKDKHSGCLYYVLYNTNFLCFTGPICRKFLEHNPLSFFCSILSVNMSSIYVYLLVYWNETKQTHL